MSRFHLAMEALKHIPRLRAQATDAIELFKRTLSEHQIYTREHFEDVPEIKYWHWTNDFSEPTEPPAFAKGRER